MVANKQGREDLARHFRSKAGGESWYSMHRDPYVRQLPYAWTHDGDFRFVQWCLENGYGCTVQWEQNHMIYADSIDSRGNIRLIDNNYPDKVMTLTKSQFLYHWRYGQGGWAGTLVLGGSLPYPLIKAL